MSAAAADCSDGTPSGLVLPRHTLDDATMNDGGLLALALDCLQTLPALLLGLLLLACV